MREPGFARPAWSAPAAGASAPSAFVIDGAAAWRAQCQRVGLVAEAAPAEWLVGRGLAVVVPAGRRLAGAPAVADEEGVQVLTFTAVAAPAAASAVYGWTLVRGGPRCTVVFRDIADPTAAEHVLWIDRP